MLFRISIAKLYRSLPGIDGSLRRETIVLVVTIVADVDFSSLSSPTIVQQSCFLAEGDNAPRSVLDCFIERNPRNPVITGKSDQLFDVRICVVPKLDGIRKIIRTPHSHLGSVEQNGNSVYKARPRSWVLALR